MRQKLILLIGVLLLNGAALAQELDAFKYIIVPKQYDFQRGEDRFQLNSLTKFLFDKKGFSTLMEGERQPEDLRANPCLGAKANVMDSSGMLTTKLIIQLMNCQNKVVFTSVEGKSKIKDKKRGQHDALRKAFRSVQEMDYRFDSSRVIVYQEPESAKEPEVRATPTETEEPTAQVQEVATPVVTAKPEEPTPSEPAPEVLQEQAEETAKPASTDLPKKTAVLYAQELENGYQLVDNTPKIVFIALKSSVENRYYLKNKAGVLYKQGDSWFAEYYKDGTLVTEALQIKF